jgi:hypothetical protein
MIDFLLHQTVLNGIVYARYVFFDVYGIYPWNDITLAHGFKWFKGIIMTTKIAGLILCAASVVLLAGCPNICILNENMPGITSGITLYVINKTEKHLYVYSSGVGDYAYVKAGKSDDLTKTKDITDQDLQTFNGGYIDFCEVNVDPSSGDLKKGSLIKRISGAELKSAVKFENDVSENNERNLYYEITVTNALL